jgi:deoxyribonuclease-4
MAEAYGARYVNVHIGSHRGGGVEAGAERLAAGVRRVLAAFDGGRPTTARGEDLPLLVLENGAGGGFGLGATMEELGLIDGALEAGGVPRERIGFCLDTAHLWGAGYPVDRADGVDATLAAFDAAVGVARLRMVHLNDSRSEPGSRTDRHEHIGAGRIGGKGLARMLTHPALAHTAYYLETPGMDEGYDAVNLARALDLAAGRPLAPLPPEAFALTSSRSRSAGPPESGGDVPRPRRSRAPGAPGRADP